MPAFKGNRHHDIAASLSTIPTGTPVSQVARRLLDLFTDGTIEPGTRLPAERQLSTVLGVGRSAVREALAALEILGVVDVRPGSGTYLRGSASDLLPETLRWGLLIGERNTESLLELRSGLEIFVARLAASRATDKQLAALRGHVTGMREALAAGDLATFSEHDGAFHRELGLAAANPMLLDQLQVVRSLLQVYADRAVQNHEAAARAAEEHEAVLDAVVAREPGAAAAAMADHMVTAEARLREAAGRA
ncbi:FadR family transcriptional regulator [Micrococcales bacterium 31B]|nr:FadR family transcriptional regulator [Micrococcales bacterium 31B]